MARVALLIQQSPQWFGAIKLAGAVYLIYVGYQTLHSQPSAEDHDGGASCLSSLAVQIGYGLFMSLAHWVWFSLVTVLFSEPRLRSRMLSRQVLLNRCIGGVLIALGFSLALASAASR